MGKTMVIAICTVMTVMFGMANMAGATPYSVTVGTFNQTLLEGSHVDIGNIGDVFTTWNVNGEHNFPLDVSLQYNDPYDTSKPGWQDLWLQGSTLNFDWTDVSAEIPRILNGDSNTSGPETATLLLLGSGLSGLSFCGKRRRVTK